MARKNVNVSYLGRGPFRADMVRPGDPYEISNGHAVVCMPTGARGGAGVMAAGIAIGSDPGLDDMGACLGAEVGYSPRPDMLRAPDLSVTPGGITESGWVKGVPPLAIEYADKGQNEQDLQQKIAELIEAGTEAIWVVRMKGPRRVEIHRADGTIQLVHPGQSLSAPGILRRPVPIEALYDREAALEHAMENHLNRFGYRSIDEIRAESRREGKKEGKKEGKREGRKEGSLDGLRAGLRRVLTRRGLAPSAEQESRIQAERDPDQLARWIDAAVDAPDAEAALSP